MSERQRQREKGGRERGRGDRVGADVIVVERSEEICEREENARARAARMSGEPSERANDVRRAASPSSLSHPFRSVATECTAIDQLYLPRAEL